MTCTLTNDGHETERNYVMLGLRLIIERIDAARTRGSLSSGATLNCGEGATNVEITRPVGTSRHTSANFVRVFPFASFAKMSIRDALRSIERCITNSRPVNCRS